jgi:ABC-type uncharacterized transport system substrate-binding protein
VLLVQSGVGGPYTAFSQALSDSLAGRPLSVQLSSLELGSSDSLTPAEMDRIRKAELVISVGARATQTVARLDRRPRTLSVLVPHVTFSAVAGGAQDMAAIYLDQPPRRYLALARVLLPELETAGIVYGPSSKAQQTEMDNAANAMDMTLHSATVGMKGVDSPLDALQNVLDTSRVLIALPDPAIYNRYTIQGILLSTFRQRVPVIGYSASMLRAGATAAAYSDAEQIARQAAEDLHRILDERGHYRHYPRYYHVRFNRAVARSLDLTVPDQSSAHELMQQMEKSDARTPGNP